MEWLHGIASAATELDLDQTCVDHGQVHKRVKKMRTSQHAYDKSCELSPSRLHQHSLVSDWQY